MTLKHFPDLERILKSYYPLFETTGWIEDEFPETGDTSYETECDNFPVSVESLTLYLEAVFYVIPIKRLFLVEAYTSLFEEFPPEIFSSEEDFLRNVQTNEDFINEMITTLAPNHPITEETPEEIVKIYQYWKHSQQVHGGGGRIIFPTEIRKKITSTLQTQLDSTDWTVLMYGEYLMDI